MESLRKLIRSIISESLNENLQQAQKLYFNNNKLPKSYQDYILNLTGGNAFTKLMSDLAYHFGKFDEFKERALPILDHFYLYLKNYDKKIIPLPFELNEYGASENTDNEHHVLTLFACLKEIYYLRKQLEQLPSLIVRNIRKEISQPNTNEYHYKSIAEKLKTLNSRLKFLPKNEEKRKMLLNKIASSNQNLDQMIEVAEHFANSFNYDTAEMDMDDFLDAMKYVDVDIIQKTSDILVIKVNSSEAMETVGCNSLWCFARPNAENYWNRYALNGYVYVILNFKKEPDEAEFMLTYLPESDEIYNSMNVYIEESGLDYLQDIGVDVKKLEVPEEVYSESIKKIKKIIQETIKKMNLTENIHVFRGGTKQYDKFDMDKIGTGDGKSVGGGEIYCSDSEEVARRYYLKGGEIKEFDISDGSYFDLDENLDEGVAYQILEELQKSGIEESELTQFQTDFIDYIPDTTNKQVYEWLSYVLGEDKNASLFLESIGYKGNKFKDKVETDATNYVLFDPRYIKNY